MRNFMRTAAAALLGAMAPVAVPVGVAAPLPGLFDTGVDALGSALGDGAVDPHYTLVASADPAYPGPAAISAQPIPSGFWVANDGTSRWIAPAANEGYPVGAPPHPAGTYTFRLTFDLTGFDPTATVVSGTWAADNSGAVHLNGAATGNAVGGFSALVPFSVGTGFVPGLNHLDFVVTNIPSGGSNPTGVRVKGIGGTSNPAVSVLEGRGGGGSFLLSRPFPNPARDLTRFHFVLSRPGAARLVVRDVAGRPVRTLADGAWPAGRSECSWDGRTDEGLPTGAGVYFVELRAEGRRSTQRIVRVR